VLSEKVDTLAEIMKPAGYATAALVDHPWIIASTGYLQGFDDIVYLHDSWAVSTKNGPALPNSSADPGYVRQAFGQALDRLGKRPFFLYLHLLYPHAAYDPPPPYDTMFGPGLKITREDPLKPVAPIYMAARDHKDRIVNMYDGEVRLTDTLLGELFDDMRRRGILDGSFVIITSDHGEGFWEHDSYEHGNTFYDEEIKVPLIVYPPAGQTVRNRHVDAVTSSIDLYPTIAAIGGAQVPGYIEGQSMLGLLEENAPCDDGRYFISEGARVDVGARAILKGDLKFISNKRPIFYNDKNFKDRELYNLRKDHLEQSNLADNRKDVLADMEKREKAHLSKAATFRDGLRGTLEKAKQTKGNLDALKSLGYTE
jgi:arylsulfatase A-like enzyme